MPKKFAFSDDGSRYHTLKYHNRRFWGRPVYKAVVDAGFTCPNIDGSCGVGGCVYCSGGSGYFTAPELSVREQILRETERIHSVHPEAGIIAYFQAHTNTYGTLGRLWEVYSEALECEICGISIATRADCLDRERAEFLASLGVPVTVELGLQTAHDSTARLINRGHDFAEFVRGFETARNAGLRHPQPVLWLLNEMNKRLAGFDLEKTDVRQSVREAKVPILFIHGALDDFVPPEMVYELYNLCPADKKELKIFDNAKHAQSCLLNEEEYHRTVDDFIRRRLPATI